MSDAEKSVEAADSTGELAVRKVLQASHGKRIVFRLDSTKSWVEGVIHETTPSGRLVAITSPSGTLIGWFPSATIVDFEIIPSKKTTAEPTVVPVDPPAPTVPNVTAVAEEVADEQPEPRAPR